MKQQKGFSSLVLIVVFVLLGGGLFYAGYQYSQKQTLPIAQPTSTPVAVITPTPDPTANWKIYTNVIYKYELKVPPSWEAFRQTGGDNIISIRPVGIKEIPITINTQGIVRTQIYKNQPVDNNDQKFLDGIVDNQVGKDHSREKKTINGKEWVFYQNTISPYKSINYLTVHGSILYEIDGSTLKEEYVTILDQILSTFKFLDQNTSCTQDSDCPEGLVCVGRGPTQPSPEIPGVCLSQKQSQGVQ